MKVSWLVSILGVVVGHCAAIDREAFTFTKYDLQVRIEPEQQRLAVRGKITLRNDSPAAQKNLALQVSSSLSWRAVRAEGKGVQFVTQPYSSDIDHTGALSEAVVTLPATIAPKGTVELEVGYEGVVPLDATRLTRIGVREQDARHSDWDVIDKPFTAVRGIGYVAWYPVATEAASLSEENSVFETIGRWRARQFDSSMRVAFQVTPGQRLWFSGETAAQARNEAAESPTSSFEIARFGNRVPTFAIASYQELEDSGSISVAFLPGSENAAKEYALAADLVSTFVGDWFGPPRKRAEVLQLDEAGAAPFEVGSALLTPLSTKTDARLTQMTAVHQLTHAALPSPRLWIEEGLAHWAQAAYREQQDGRAAAIQFMGLHGRGVLGTERVIAAARDPDSAARNSLINTSIPELYRGKALFVWWMLRDMIGDTAFRKVVLAYRADEDKDPAYVQHLVATQTRRDLEWFFDDWVYRDRGLPDFRVESVFPRKTLGGAYIVTVTVENLGGAGAEVPLTVKVEGGEVTGRLEVRAKSRNSVRIETPSAPQQVIINDGSVLESDVSNNTFKVDSPSR